ncbi:MAG TPA: CBS domain-containing protein [Actinomycetota bacterium]
MNVESVYRPGVVCAEADDPLSEVASRMQFNEIGALAVIDHGSLVGIITERDLVRAVADGTDTELTPAGEYMTEDPVVVAPDADVHEAVTRMLDIGVRHLPVMSGGRLLGMVSARDLLAEAQG